MRGQTQSHVRSSRVHATGRQTLPEQCSRYVTSLVWVVLSGDSSVWTAHLNLANAYNALKKYGLANKHFVKAIELSPKEPVSLFTYAQSLREQEKYERAIAFYKLAAKYSPKEAEEIGQLIELCFKQMTSQMGIPNKDEQAAK